MKRLLFAALVLSSCDRPEVGLVTVDLGSPFATVLFYNATGQLIQRSEAPNGHAEAVVPAGGSVIVVRDSFWDLGSYWVHDVQPGDRLQLGGFRSDPIDFPPEQIPAQVLLPPPPEGFFPDTTVICGEDSYDGWPTAGSFGEGNVLELEACGNPFDLVVAGGDFDEPLYLVATDVQLDDFSNARVESEYAPADRFSVGVSGWTPSGGAFIHVRGERQVFALTGSVAPVDGRVELRYLAGLGDEGATVLAGVRDDGVWLQLYQRGGAADDLHFDPTGVPSVHDVRVSGAAVSWSIDGNVDDVDLVTVNLDGWQVIVPPGRRSLRRPALPADLADLWPAKLEGASVSLAGKASVAGWDEARQRPLAVGNFRDTSEAISGWVVGAGSAATTE